MGFTKSLVTGVWMGYDRYDYPLGKYETGGRASLPTWIDYMKAALGDRPQEDFDTPAPGLNIVKARIDINTGKLAAPGAPYKETVNAPFVKGKEPVEQALSKEEVDPREMMWMAP